MTDFKQAARSYFKQARAGWNYMKQIRLSLITRNVN